MKKLICLSVVGILGLIPSFPSQAQAWDVSAKVTTIEPSYMPDQILFRIDTVAGTCPAGTWIYYYGTNYKEVTNSKKNVQAIYAGLLAAVISGKNVEVHGNDECIAINIHISNQP